MSISLKADSSGTFGEVLVNGSPALKVSNGLLELPDGKDFFNQGNIVGTVSQSGGIPTGAVVERGSNANGEYVRFADGTQICMKRGAFSASGVTNTSGAIYSSAESAWNYPATFIGDMVALIPTRSTFGGAWCGAGSTPNTVNTGYSVLMWISTLAVPVTWDGLAIGRWF